MIKTTYTKPTVKTYGEVAELTRSAIAEKYGISTGQILDSVPSQYQRRAQRYIERGKVPSWAEDRLEDWLENR